MGTRHRKELSELVVHAGAGFVAKDRPIVRAALSTLRPHLGNQDTDDVTVEVSLQDRGRKEQRVTLRITLPEMTPIVAVAANADVMRALDEAKSDAIRQLRHYPYAPSRRRRISPIFDDQGFDIAITDIARYTHLSASDIERLGSELDAIRSDIEDSLGAPDAAYIRRTILFQRTLDIAARLLIAGTRSKAAWAVGAAALGFAKSVENMEIGHNVSHGQWDWMNDPEIHSSTWEWDMVAVSSQWKYSHNYRHHVFSNVLGVDDDLGFGVMRVTRDQPWKRQYVLQPLQNLLLALTFEWGIAAHGVDLERSRAEKLSQSKALVVKVARQGIKDYVMWPALSVTRWRRTLGANAVANLLRNLWAYVVIFCGHFPDGTQKFTPDILQSETKAEWYLRQMLGAANFKAGPLLGFASGNLCYQIEHHLFPDLPSNRLAEIAARVRPLCAKYGLPYLTGSLAHQYGSTLRAIHRLALPDGFLGVGQDADIAAIRPRGRLRQRRAVRGRRRVLTPVSRRRFVSRAA